MELERQPEKVEFILSRYLKLNNVTEKDFYFDAAINHAKCAFVKEKYGAALDRLGYLTDNKTNQAAVWNNIAIYNANVGKLDRAEKNIAKAFLPQATLRHTSIFSAPCIIPINNIVLFR